MRSIPWEKSLCRSTAAATAGSVKLGQPVPESNLASEANSSAPHAAQRYMPSSWQSKYSPVNGASVPACLSTRYWAGVSSCRHCSSVLVMLWFSLMNGHHS